MGMVYLGYDIKLQRHVAIKTIRREEIGDDEISTEYARRFELEAKAIAMLKHPNIVAVHDFGEEAGIAYMVMEFVEGHDLKHYFDDKFEFSLAETLRLMTDLLEALAHAHEKGVWHRDIKPANVMIDVNGQVKLTDFGVSRINGNAEQTRTTNTQVGTLFYMSPEQVLNSGISQRSDIFAAGVILYQFLTGVRPFTGSDFEVSNKIVREMPTRPSQLNPLVSMRVDAVVETAMAKLPEHRYASAREFATALQQALGDKQEPLFDMDATRHFYATQGSKNAMPPLPTSRDSSLPYSQSGQSGQLSRSASQTSVSENAEIEFWRSIKDGSDSDEFKLYLAHFPHGTYAALARMRIEKLADAQSSPSGTGPVPLRPQPAPSQTQPTHNHAGVVKIEPSFATTSADHTGSEAAPVQVPPNRPKRSAWIIPIALLLLLLLPLGLWFAQQKPSASSEVASKQISTATPLPMPSATPSAAPIASTTQNTNATTNTPAVNALAATGSTPDLAAEKKKLDALRAENLQLELKKQKELQELARTEKHKREEEAAKAARENIRRADGSIASATATATKEDLCPGQASYTAPENDKAEAVCNELKAKTEKWIARWKSADGIAKGQDKFKEPHTNKCVCQPGGECQITVGYLRPCA